MKNHILTDTGNIFKDEMQVVVDKRGYKTQPISKATSSPIVMDYLYLESVISSSTI